MNLLIVVATGLLLLGTQTRAQIPLLDSCPSSANYTSGSQFEKNLKLLFTSLIANGSRYGFFNTTSGENPDKVYGLAQCRGDISMDACRRCLNISSVEIVKSCPNRKVATIRFTECLLRHSNFDFFSQLDTSHIVTRFNPIANASNPDLFNRQLGNLMNNLSSSAASKASKFETGSIKFTELVNIYGLVQCTRDLSESDCYSCLQLMFKRIPYGTPGADIASLSCIIKYEIYPFFISSSAAPSPAPVEAASPAPAG